MTPKPDLLTYYRIDCQVGHFRDCLSNYLKSHSVVQNLSRLNFFQFRYKSKTIAVMSIVTGKCILSIIAETSDYKQNKSLFIERGLASAS